MMRSLSNKKNVKAISVIVGAIFVIGIAGLAYMQMSAPVMAAPSSNIAVVDVSKVIPPNSPIMEKANATMEAYIKDLQAQFDKESQGMDDEAKQKLFMQYQQKIQEKNLEVQKGMEKEVSDAVQSVAEGKGMSIAINKAVVLYGGNDITEAVAQKLAGQGSDKK